MGRSFGGADVNDSLSRKRPRAHRAPRYQALSEYPVSDFPDVHNVYLGQKSWRVLDMPRELAHELKLWKLKCPPSHQALVLTNIAGGFIHRKNAGNIFDAIVARAEIRRLTFHKLSHTFASLLLSKGKDITEVSRLLGAFGLRDHAQDLHSLRATDNDHHAGSGLEYSRKVKSGELPMSDKVVSPS